MGGKDTANEIVNSVGEKGDGGGGSYNISVLPTTKKILNSNKRASFGTLQMGGIDHISTLR